MQIETKIMEQVKTVLHQFGTKYMTESGVLKRNTVINDLDKYDRDLITALLSNQLIYDEYTEKIADADIFKLNQFINMFEYKEFWEDSFTKYANRIGLTGDDKFISDSSDVVLDFPYKDTVLKAGMSKEDVDSEVGEDEPFLNETLAHSEISELFEPKILVNAKRHDKDGEHDATYFNDQDNLIIKGNNLNALYSLQKRYVGKVKLIYIDPPYNTGSDSFAYNDKFNHSAWLTFMKNRLEIAYDLLAENGILWVQTDDTEVNYLGVLLDEIFGRNNFINLVTVKTKIGGVSGSSEGKSLKDATEFIQVYAKNKEQIKLEPVYAMTPVWDYINEEYLEAGKSWKYNSVLTEVGERQLIKCDEKSNRKYYHYPNAKQMSVKQYATEHNMTEEDVYNYIPDKIFRSTNAQSSVRTTVMEETKNIDTGLVSIEYVPTKGKNKDKLTEIFYTTTGATNMLMFLSDMLTEGKDGRLLYKEKLTTLWDNIQYNNLSKEGKVDFPDGKKPEKLLQNVIEMSSYKGDIVLDFFGGSGSTAAVAHKLGRKWITCEQIDSQIEIMKKRLQNVVDGKDDKGISTEVEWTRGGSFVYAELMEKNQGYLKDLLATKDINELNAVYKRMKAVADFDFRVDLDKYENDAERKALPFDEQKKLLIKMLDKNQLYYNEANIDDADVRDLISDSDYRFNKSFYGKESE
ncbi:site-specific DNA-methyltransferase [Companilactobacillus jidongensis]|uniref:site-specific DNA-methyltransferase n=1 Tax=Companilactobacillus jidongensis TaxID=2486006 RepID=UPI0013DDCBA8|nr:site-specific DNA-methyltransferase [Companilactobacillus jidongensis]